MADMNQVQLPSYDEVCAKRLENQNEYGKKLDEWINIPNNDIRKLIFLYPMLDGRLFYDFLSKQDTKKFSLELSSMSTDIECFSDENLNFFKIGAKFFYNYSISPENVINEEEDLKFDELTEQFFIFNQAIFKSFEEGFARKA